MEAALGPVRDGYIELYVEELLTPDRANLRVRVRFENGRLLEISEALVVENECLRHLDYRYHCQDAGNDLVFRCDSAPHFPELPLFPHHKHLAEATEPAERPPIDRVLLEAGRVLAR